MSDAKVIQAKLSIAFTNLRTSGINTEENFSGTPSDAWAEIEPGSDDDLAGFAYYTDWALETGAPDGRVTIGYGCKKEEATLDDQKRVGLKVRDALEESGIKTDWDEDPESTIGAVFSD